MSHISLPPDSNHPATANEPLNPTTIRQGVHHFLETSDGIEADISYEPCYRVKQGVHHIVWAVGQHFLHALPSTLKNRKSLQRDRAITSLVKQHIPCPETISVPSEPFPIGGWICTLQERLRGTSLRDLSGAPTREETMDGLTELLRALRCVPYDAAMEALYYEGERPNLQKRVTKALKRWEELKAGGYVQDPGGRMKGALSLEPSRSLETVAYRPVLLHGDLSMEHVLVDEFDGKITGVIDWSDAMLGDPCEDIAGVVLCLGPERARKVAVAAGYDEQTVERSVLYAKCVAVCDLWEVRFGTENQPSEELTKAQFRMAFEEKSVITNETWIFWQ